VSAESPSEPAGFFLDWRKAAVVSKPISLALAIGFAGAALLSVALSQAALAQSGTMDVEAGPIWSQADAQNKCPAAAAANGGVWTGQWKTTVPGQMSVCEIRRVSPGGGYVKNFNAGPIWSQADAQNKCPAVAAANGGVWTGQWKTTVPGQMSVCEVRVARSRAKRVVNVEAGPIWSQADAQNKCPAVATANGGVWTGQWNTTVPGQMSVCQIRLSL
jgi:hypothetical protein